MGGAFNNTCRYKTDNYKDGDEMREEKIKKIKKIYPDR